MNENPSLRAFCEQAMCQLDDRTGRDVMEVVTRLEEEQVVRLILLLGAEGVTATVSALTLDQHLNPGDVIVRNPRSQETKVVKRAEALAQEVVRSLEAIADYSLLEQSAKNRTGEVYLGGDVAVALKLILDPEQYGLTSPEGLSLALVGLIDHVLETVNTGFTSQVAFDEAAIDMIRQKPRERIDWTPLIEEVQDNEVLLSIQYKGMLPLVLWLVRTTSPSQRRDVLAELFQVKNRALAMAAIEAMARIRPDAEWLFSVIQSVPNYLDLGLIVELASEYPDAERAILRAALEKLNTFRTEDNQIESKWFLLKAYILMRRALLERDDQYQPQYLDEWRLLTEEPVQAWIDNQDGFVGKPHDVPPASDLDIEETYKTLSPAEVERKFLAGRAEVLIYNVIEAIKAQDKQYIRELLFDAEVLSYDDTLKSDNTLKSDQPRSNEKLRDYEVKVLYTALRITLSAEYKQYHNQEELDSPSYGGERTLWYHPQKNMPLQWRLLRAGAADEVESIAEILLNEMNAEARTEALRWLGSIAIAEPFWKDAIVEYLRSAYQGFVDTHHRQGWQQFPAEWEKSERHFGSLLKQWLAVLDAEFNYELGSLRE